MNRTISADQNNIQLLKNAATAVVKVDGCLAGLFFLFRRLCRFWALDACRRKRRDRRTQRESAVYQVFLRQWSRNNENARDLLSGADFRIVFPRRHIRRRFLAMSTRFQPQQQPNPQWRTNKTAGGRQYATISVCPVF